MHPVAESPPGRIDICRMQPPSPPQRSNVAFVQARLDETLTRVLGDFLPICAHCKAIREGDRWVPLESYVMGHTKTLFSHGLCPKCLPLY